MQKRLAEIVGEAIETEQSGDQITTGEVHLILELGQQVAADLQTDISVDNFHLILAQFQQGQCALLGILRSVLLNFAKEVNSLERTALVEMQQSIL
jgi:hypothetical protein